MKKGIKAFILLLLISLQLLGYTRPRYGGEFRISFPAELSLQPDVSWESLFYQSLLYANFFIMESDGNITSYIFESWSEEEGGWRFVLRKNIYFHDGSPILAEHVRSSLLEFLNSSLPGSFSLSRKIREILIESDRILSIKTTQSYNLPRLLSNPYLLLKTEGKFSGPFYPEEDYLLPNIFFPKGRPFLSKILFVYPSSEADLVPYEKNGYKALPERKYLLYLLVPPKFWPSKMQRRCIYSTFIRANLGERADSYFLPNFSDFTLDFPTETARTIKRWVRRRVKLAIPSKLSFLQSEIETAFSRVGVKISFVVTEDPLGALKSKMANVALFYSTAILLEDEPKEIADMILRYKLNSYYSWLTEEVNKLEAASNLEEKARESLIARIYERLASREFFFPVAIMKIEWYVNPEFEGFLFDYYHRLHLEFVRKKLVGQEE